MLKPNLHIARLTKRQQKKEPKSTNFKHETILAKRSLSMYTENTVIFFLRLGSHNPCMPSFRFIQNKNKKIIQKLHALQIFYNAGQMHTFPIRFLFSICFTHRHTHTHTDAYSSHSECNIV